MNESFVVDTMALVLWLEKRKLSKQVKRIFMDAEKNNLKIYIPAMVLAEVGYLAEKNRIDVKLSEIRKYIESNDSIYVSDITSRVIFKCFEITDIPELHDRLITATALKNKLILITNDPIISASKLLKTFW